MITTSQVAVTTTPAALCTVPAGPCMVVLSSDPASADTAYYGTGTVTSSNGVPLAPGQSAAFAVYGGSRSQAMSVVCGTGTATVGVMISIAGG